MRFVLACLAFLLVLAVVSFYGLALYVYNMGGITWEQSEKVVWIVLNTIPFWKMALAIAMLGALSYVSIWWSFAPFARKM